VNQRTAQYLVYSLIPVLMIMCGACPRGKVGQSLFGRMQFVVVLIYGGREIVTTVITIYFCAMLLTMKGLFMHAPIAWGIRFNAPTVRWIKLLFSLSIFAWVYVCK
jgi:hypothetical protein